MQSKSRMLLINLLFILFIGIFYYYFLFIPSQSILKRKIENEYISNMKMESILLDNTISRYIQGSKSISSRSMIRKKIADFYIGKINRSFMIFCCMDKMRYVGGIKSEYFCTNLIRGKDIRRSDQQVPAMHFSVKSRSPF